MQSNGKYQPAGSNATGFNNSRQYDRFIGQACKERNFWRLAAIAALVIIGVQFAGWMYAVRLPDTAYHVIEIAPWGEAKNIGVAGKNSYSDIQRPEQSIHYYLRDFIARIRTVSTDKAVIAGNLNTAFHFVTTTGSNLLKSLLGEDPLFDRADTQRVEIVIESILVSSQYTYQVDWYERVYSLQGEYRTTNRFRGIFNLYFAQPNATQVVHNPLGIFVDEFSIQQIQTK